ncbi:MAG: hypothetical protein ACR2OF_02870 [Hyphomicrobium sp.]
MHAFRAKIRLPALQFDSEFMRSPRIADEERMIRDMPSTVENLGEKWTHAFAVLDMTCNAKKLHPPLPRKATANVTWDLANTCRHEHVRRLNES